VSDYLWDKRGEDAEVERLETQLQPLAYRGTPPRLPRRPPVLIYAGIATAAAALVLLSLWPRSTGWQREGRAVAAGEWLESGELASDLGKVRLAPGTRLRIVDHGRLELERGSLAAQIHAPPRRFSVAMHDLVAIDLGCAFELSVNAAGQGRIRVTEGRVALARHAKEVVVPAGAECAFSSAGAETPHESAPVEKIEPQKIDPVELQRVGPIKPPTGRPIELPKVEPKAKKLRVEQPHVAPQQNPAAPQKAPAAPQKAPAAPQRAPAAPQRAPAAPQKNEDPLRLHHDSLKDLDRSL
jgi:hypothetical protein